MNQQETTMDFQEHNVSHLKKTEDDENTKGRNEILKKDETLTNLRNDETLTDETLRPANEDPTKDTSIKDEDLKSAPKKSETLTEVPIREETLINGDKTLKKLTVTSKLAMDDQILTKISVTSRLSVNKENSKNNTAAVSTGPDKVTEKNEFDENVTIQNNRTMKDENLTKERNCSDKNTFSKMSRYETSDNLSDNFSMDGNWDQLSNQNSTDTKINVEAMPNIIGFITMSFNEYNPYEFTITTMTHYISGKCDSNNMWLYNLNDYIKRLNISVLYAAGPKQKNFISQYIDSASIQYIYSHFYCPPKRKCPKCARHGCSMFKATSILCYNFGFSFTIPCTYQSSVF